MIPLLLIPLITKLAASGLDMIGNAVLNKGKAFVEEKLNVSLDDEIGSEEGKIKLRQLQADNEEKLLSYALENRKIDFDYYKSDADDRKSARDMNSRLQESLTSFFAKNFAYGLDTVIVCGTLALTCGLFFKTIPSDNLQIANIALGTLLGLCVTVVNFHRGTSSGSQNKDKVMANMSENLK